MTSDETVSNMSIVAILLLTWRGSAVRDDGFVSDGLLVCSMARLCRSEEKRLVDPATKAADATAEMKRRIAKNRTEYSDELARARSATRWRAAQMARMVAKTKRRRRLQRGNQQSSPSKHVRIKAVKNQSSRKTPALLSAQGFIFLFL